MRTVTPFPAMSSLLRLTKRSNLDKLILTICGWKNLVLHHFIIKIKSKFFAKNNLNSDKK